MKNRFIGVIVEYFTFDIVALILICKFYIVPHMEKSSPDDIGAVEAGVLIFASVMLAVTVLVFIQVYFFIVKPYLDKIHKLEKAAEESSRTEAIRREFVANVTHELKTPLTSIAGFIETLQAGASEEPEIRTRFIDIISIETARLKRLIEDLLVLSDIENKKETETHEFDMRNALENTVEILAPIAEEKGIEIILDTAERIFIKGSVDRFSQMMMNLIENAIKYTDRGGAVRVTLTKGSEHTTVSVKDTGIGIAPEHHDRLFERFYRVDKSRSKKAGGTGLGLSIVKHIAALFDARLEVKSEVGKGSEFFVIFDNDS